MAYEFVDYYDDLVDYYGEEAVAEYFEEFGGLDGMVDEFTEVAEDVLESWGTDEDCGLASLASEMTDCLTSDDPSHCMEDFEPRVEDVEDCMMDMMFD